MSTATDVGVDLDLTTDDRPECDATHCSNEAVWHYVWETPCNCPWQVCDPHRGTSESDGDLGTWWRVYVCGTCGSDMGHFVRWERV